MKPRCITLSCVPKESHIIVRCEPELRQRLQRIAILERRNLSDLARLVFEDYVAHQERAMHLTLGKPTPRFTATTPKPNSTPNHSASVAIVDAAAKRAQQSAAPASNQPATYSSRHQAKPRRSGAQKKKSA